jgi:hypothetical protein
VTSVDVSWFNGCAGGGCSGSGTADAPNVIAVSAGSV